MSLRIPQENQEPVADSATQWSDTLSLLRSKASASDAQGFGALASQVVWRDRSATDLISVIRLALQAGAPLVARNLSTEGLSLFAANEEVQKFARILAVPVCERVDADPSSRLNREWLNAHVGEYSGQWVAIRDGQLVATAGSLRELIDRVGDTSATLLTKAY